ncbi:uncharacterized protein EI90DRAFT_2241045 [Cantharellus anzutake]|uniref:uncharacterized protein n=1 Tax=Cantharellus anzutake TaxID=1750568 RepID=UPI00190886FE|nr:uncharacterized protein EI90DRAFT_2241045 [Cantharellus anzutake]KAF8324697.1 hypothetical protein EI90DRAFT_2241045 [Cantharellus anzutake]
MKKCPLDPDLLGSCKECTKFGIKCEGFDSRFPSWTKNPEQLKQYKEMLRGKIASKSTRWTALRTDLGRSHPSGEPPNHAGLSVGDIPAPWNPQNLMGHPCPGTIEIPTPAATSTVYLWEASSAFSTSSPAGHSDVAVNMNAWNAQQNAQYAHYYFA